MHAGSVLFYECYNFYLENVTIKFALDNYAQFLLDKKYVLIHLNYN